MLRVEKQEETENDRYPPFFRDKDSGVGIPLDKQQSIFEGFTQADNSMSRKFGGTGLVLPSLPASSKRWAAASGWRARAGHGKHFPFQRPLRCAEKSRPTGRACFARV